MSFLFAKDFGISICNNVHPFNEPRPDIMANIAIGFLMLSPNTVPIASANGAFELAI